MTTTDNSRSHNIGVIVLAAGDSSRLGSPKQLLVYGGHTFLQHSIQVALASQAGPVVVVLGAYADRIEKQVDSNAVQVVVNTEWEEGMASSVRQGIATLERIEPFATGVIFMVCDQPYVTPGLLNSLIAAHQKTGKPIVACSYENTFGPPVFFHKDLFPELLRLQGDAGAKSVIKKYAGEAELVLFPEGGADVDTAADYEKIVINNPKS